MKNYTITVNGTVYDVAVEEKAAGAAPVAPVAATPAAPAPSAPVAKPVQGTGSVQITSPMPGKILGVKANPGTAVKRGDVVLILEAMKMENEVVAPQDGTIAGINVNSGDMVESGDVLATMD